MLTILFFAAGVHHTLLRSCYCHFKILEFTEGKSTHSQFIHDTKSETAPQSRGNRQCGDW